MREILPLSVPGEISNEDRQKKDWLKTVYLRTQADSSRSAFTISMGWTRLSRVPAVAWTALSQG